MKNIKVLLVALLSSFLTVSCLVDDEKAQVETDASTRPYVVGFKGGTTVTSFFTDGSTQLLKQPIDLLGGFSYTSTPSIDVTYEVDATQTTAVAGTDYDFVTSGSANIPANRDFGTIDINVYTGAMDVNNPKVLVLRLTGASNNAIIGDNGVPGFEYQYETVRIVLQGVCFSDLAGPYNNPDVNANNGDVTISETGAANSGNYACTAVPYLTAGGNPIPFNFTDVCDQLTITGWQFDGTYLIEGSGTKNADNTLTFTYTVYNGPSNTDPVFFDFSGNPSTYTPN